jgi:hypothetical protein
MAGTEARPTGLKEIFYGKLKTENHPYDFPDH